MTQGQTTPRDLAELVAVANEVLSAVLLLPKDHRTSELSEAAVKLASALEALTPSAPLPDDVERVAAMRDTALELRANANGDCGAIKQAMMWEAKASALSAFPPEDWRYDVAYGETKLGYADWLAIKALSAQQQGEVEQVVACTCSAPEWVSPPHHAYKCSVHRTTPVPKPSEREQRETFASIIAWGDETFGPAEPGRIISRAAEEWKEMLEPDADIPTEAADVIIVLLRMPGIAEAIQRKMQINRAREWKLMGDGTGYHVPTTGGHPA